MSGPLRTSVWHPLCKSAIVVHLMQLQHIFFFFFWLVFFRWPVWNWSHSSKLSLFNERNSAAYCILNWWCQFLLQLFTAETTPLWICTTSLSICCDLMFLFVTHKSNQDMNRTFRNTGYTGDQSCNLKQAGCTLM